MKEFHISDILTVTTGILVSTRHMDGVYDILNYMTGDNLFTHQIPRANTICKPYLLEQHPQLIEFTGEDVNEHNWKEWIADAERKLGEKLPVYQIPESDYQQRDPIDELIKMTSDKEQTED